MLALSRASVHLSILLEYQLGTALAIGPERGCEPRHPEFEQLRRNDKYMLNKMIKAVLTSSVVAGALAVGSPARADVVDCVPERVRSYSDRMDTRCVGVDRWFIAMRSSTDSEHLNQMIALLNS